MKRAQPEVRHCALMYTDYRASRKEALKELSMSQKGNVDKGALLAALRKNGFALINFSEIGLSDEALIFAADKLGVGAPYVPEYFNRMGGCERSRRGIATIRSNTVGTHAGFQSHRQQEMHVDGTLNELGEINTTILACCTPAIIGGFTIVGNCLALLNSIRQKNLLLVEALFNERALTRSAVSFGGESTTGPIFGRKRGYVFTRFSCDNTSKWNFGKVDNLSDAFHSCAMEMGYHSPYVIAFAMKSLQALVLCNSRVCHARSAFQDSSLAPRTMKRMIFKPDLLQILM